MDLDAENRVLHFVRFHDDGVIMFLLAGEAVATHFITVKKAAI